MRSKKPTMAIASLESGTTLSCRTLSFKVVMYGVILCPYVTLRVLLMHKWPAKSQPSFYDVINWMIAATPSVGLTLYVEYVLSHVITRMHRCMPVIT